ncbi:DeoR family transcriptional regulator, partial [Bacillus anthracis]
ILHMYEDEKSC